MDWSFIVKMLEQRCLLMLLILTFNLTVVVWKYLPEKNSPIYLLSNALKLNTNATNELTIVIEGNQANMNISLTNFDLNNTNQHTEQTEMENFKLVDLQDFHYIIKPDVCTDQIFGLIIVHSAIQNVDKRALVRETWGESYLAQIVKREASMPLRVLFTLGAIDDANVQTQLVQESRKHADILQGSFVDTYHNITYKHIMGLKWFLKNCRNAKMLIKVDDDVFVNTPTLIQYFQSVNSYEHKGESNFLLKYLPSQKNILLCDKNTNSWVRRSYRSKWRVSFREYAKRFFPNFCSGYAIIYSRDVVAQLYFAAQKHRFFWIDDVFVTGMLAQQQNIQIMTAKNIFLTKDKIDKFFEQNKTVSKPEFLFTSYIIKTSDFRRLWKKIFDS